ncbi:MAG: metallophosphoesterase (TIGR00282 family) [Rickettsiales bacterium]|jgi:metallophosphoesterase (TIGR00282 family)
MKILFCGDLVGRAGRKTVEKFVPKLKEELDLDLVIANVDNASGGFGVNKNACEDLIKIGVDVMTGGDHVWDQKETIGFINSQPKLLRPLNFPKHTPGNGYIVFTTKKHKKILVIHLLGQVFIKNNLNCPFEMVEDLLKHYQLKTSPSFANINPNQSAKILVDAIVVDMHAEATSEKMAMGKFLDGKVSMVVGSHTHIPTNDCHIMKQGTAYQTDTGMCGDYDSVIGMQEGVPIKSFLTKRRVGKMEPATGEATFCGVLAEIDENTGMAIKIEPLKFEGTLLKQTR